MVLTFSDNLALTISLAIGAVVANVSIALAFNREVQKVKIREEF